MGTFLRVWRQEWVGMTRAQLATAVTAAGGPRVKVTEGVIRKWESGQPPHSTDHLRALLRVMARKGLVPGEIDAFRDLVLAAVGERQYPELYGDEPIVGRPDVDEYAMNEYVAEMGAPSHRVSPEFVRYTAEIHELEEALGAQHSGAEQMRKQQIALIHLRGALMFHTSGRQDRLSARLALANLRLIRGCFGPRGLSDHLSVDGMRMWALSRLAWGRPPVYTRMLAFSREVLDRGNLWLGAGSLALACSCLPNEEKAEVLPEVLALVPQVEERLHPFDIQGMRWNTAIACTALHEFGLAEDYVGRLEQLLPQAYQPPFMYWTLLGYLREQQEDYGEAIRFCEMARDSAYAWDMPSQAPGAIARIEACERALARSLRARRRNAQLLERAAK